MQRPRVRFTLRTMMITVAVAAVAFALIAARWNRPPILDPFDPIEMIGRPGPKPSEIWKRYEYRKGEARVFPTPLGHDPSPERIQ